MPALRTVYGAICTDDEDSGQLLRQMGVLPLLTPFETANVRFRAGEIQRVPAHDDRGLADEHGARDLLRKVAVGRGLVRLGPNEHAAALDAVEVRSRPRRDVQ